MMHGNTNVIFLYCEIQETIQYSGFIFFAGKHTCHF